jgi:hypothetical protein
VSDVCQLVANSHAPRFYITTEKALEQYRSYVHGKSCVCNEEKRKMYAEIFSKFEYLMSFTKGDYTMYDIMEIVLAQPASSFYIKDPVSYYYRAMRWKRYKARKK